MARLRRVQRQRRLGCPSACLMAVAGLLCLLPLESCGRKDTSTPAPSDVTLQIGTALPKMGGSVGVGQVQGALVSDQLVSTGWDGSLVPQIAQSWEWDGSRRVIRFKLHPEVRFHDGTLLDAASLADILRQTAADSLPISSESITRISATADGALEIRLSRAEAFLLPELPEASIARTSEGQTIGTGPFVPDGVAFRSFEQYYRGRPAISRIEFKEYPTQRSAWTALLRGEISVLHEVSRDAVEFFEAQKEVAIYPFTRPYYYSMVFNQKHPVLRQAEVRRALSQAVDRERIIKEAIRGLGQVADAPIWPFHWAYGSGQRRYSYNPEAAGLRLDAAGFRVQRRKNEAGMPRRLEFTCLILRGEPLWERIALVLQKQLFDVGVDMKVLALPPKDLIPRLGTGDFDALLMETVSARSLAWLYSFWHSKESAKSAFLTTGYSAADAALDRLRHATSDEETRSALAECQRIFFDDPPAVFIAWPQQYRAVTAAFDVQSEPGRDILGSLWQWRPTTDSMARR